MPFTAIARGIKPQIKNLSSKTPVGIDMQSVTSVILGGGQGTRLLPLTKSRCKPAVLLAGRYRLIDFSLSNAIHSGCKNCYVLTQYLNASLHEHLNTLVDAKTHLEIISSENGPLGNTYFDGTADAVRKSIPYFLQSAGDYILVLSGDQIYQMNFNSMLQTALKTKADVVIGAIPITEAQTKRMGVLQVDQTQFITNFVEKPQTQDLVAPFKLQKSQKERLKISLTEDKNYIGSMGIYLFKKQALLDLLKEDPREDFGKHLIPTKVTKGKIAAHIHEGYWEDIGTVKSFYEANMALTHPTPPFNCYDQKWPILTSLNQLPGAKIDDTQIKHSLFCEGVISYASEISNSILGPRTTLEKGCVIRDSYILGADKYENSKEQKIGKNTHIYKAIIDMNVTIGSHVQLTNRQNLNTFDSNIATIRDGIIIIPSGVTIPDGYIL